MTQEELNKLTPEEKRVKIAEACGWKKWQNEEMLIWGGQGANSTFISAWIWTPPERHPVDSAKSSPPDYLNDLNAMHEAEKKFNNSKDADIYIHHLVKLVRNIITRPDTLVLNIWTIYAIASASAAQRADAFLLTL